MKNVAITVGLSRNNEYLWYNGIKLNALYMLRLLRNSGKYNAFLVNTTSKDITEFSWNTDEFPTYHISDMLDDIDVLISIGGQINMDTTLYLKSMGTKIVSYKCGDEYTLRMEHIIFNKDYKKTKIWANPYYDEIWMVPQIYEQNYYYSKRLHKNKNVKSVPFIWSSVFLDEINKQLNGSCDYVPNGKGKSIAIMEPNNDVLKYCMYPMLIVDNAYEIEPSLIKHLYVTNTSSIRSNNLFVDIVTHLDIVKDGIATFEDRYNTAFFLSKYADIVVSHQWDNPLNYAYLDVVYFGHPLLHNAMLCKDIGYYYDRFDGDEGTKQLLRILREHDDNHEEYVEKNKQVLSRYDADNEKNIDAYIKLIESIK